MKADWEQPALQGLPEYGVLLTGTPENPVIENRSGRAVIAYTLKKADQNGHGMNPLTLLAVSGQPAGIPDGGAVYAHLNVPVNLARQMQALGVFYSPLLTDPIQGPLAGRGPIVSATLRCVVFGDGQFVGVEELWVFEQFGRMIKVIVEVGLLAKTGAWEQVEALAQLPLGPLPRGEDPRTYFERRLTATHLVQERKWKGDAGAMQLAEIYCSLPTLWQWQPPSNPS
jgi:hypothetical protein